MSRERAEVAAWLRDEINRGNYQPGERLPSQRQLGELAGASPNTVAEALKILASEGLVRIRDRSGAKVTEPSERLPEAVSPARTARETLQQVQADVHAVRQQLGDLEERVADALSKLGR